MTHGYDTKHPDAPPHPFWPVCRWKPVGWRLTGNARFIRHDGQLWRWVHNVSQADMARPEIQEELAGRQYIFTDPYPTTQRGGHELVENGVLGLCILSLQPTINRPGEVLIHED